jgi:DNA-binding MarR family transcriptional regulator
MKPSEKRRRQVLVSDIAVLLNAFMRRMRGRFRVCAGELDLAPTEAQALWLIDLAGTVTPKELAQRLDIDPANTSTLLTALERRSLVERRTSPRDRRVRLVALTEDGLATRQALARCIARGQPAIGQLTTDELVAFRDILRRLEGDAGGGAPAPPP